MTERKTKHPANWMEQSPVEPRADHSGYFPNTEHLGEDEMRRKETTND